MSCCASSSRYPSTSYPPVQENWRKGTSEGVPLGWETGARVTARSSLRCLKARAIASVPRSSPCQLPRTTESLLTARTEPGVPPQKQHPRTKLCPPSQTRRGRWAEAEGGPGAGGGPAAAAAVQPGGGSISPVGRGAADPAWGTFTWLSASGAFWPKARRKKLRS